MRPDGEAQAGHSQAEVSATGPGAATLSQQRSSWFTSCFARSPSLSLSLSRARCKESESPHAVTVYMLEPQTCQYVLGVSLTQSKESLLRRASVWCRVYFKWSRSFSISITKRKIKRLSKRSASKLLWRLNVFFSPFQTSYSL